MGALSLVSLMGYRYSLCHFLRQIYHLIIQSTKSDQIKPRNLQNKDSQMLSKNVHIYIYKYGHTTGISRQFIKSSGYLRVPLSHIVLYFDYCFRYFCFPIPTLWYHHKRYPTQRNVHQ